MPLFKCGGGSLKQLTLTPAGQTTYNIAQLLPDKYDTLNVNNFSIASFQSTFCSVELGGGYGSSWPTVNMLQYDASTGVLTIGSGASFGWWKEGAGVVTNRMAMKNWTVVVNYI